MQNAGTKALAIAHVNPLECDSTEEEVLALCLASASWFAKIAARIDASDFGSERCRGTFEAVQTVRAKGFAEPAQILIAVKDALRESEKEHLFSLQEDVTQFLFRLTDLGCLIAPHGKDYNSPSIEKLIEVSRRRQILGKAQQTINALRDGDTSDELLRSWQEFIFEKTRQGSANETINIKSTLDKIVDELEKGVPFGIPSGFDRLDELTHGWQPGRRYILGARPSVGKSTLLGWFAWYALLAQKNVLLFSVEVDSQTFARFFLSQISRIAADKMVNPEWLQNEDWSDIASAIGALTGGGKLLVNDDGGLTLEKFISHTYAAHAEHGIDLILLDYIQRMDRPKDNSTAREVGKLSAGISAVAQQLRIPTICAAQLNRELEHRQDKRPVLADLRESGDLEQDADVVMFLWRDEYKTDEQAQGREEIGAHLGVAKNRFGALGRIDLMHRPWLREFFEV